MLIIGMLVGSSLVTLLAYFLTKKVLSSTGKQETTPQRTLLFSSSAIILYSYFSTGLDMLIYYIPYLIFWFLIDFKRSNKR